MRRVTLLCSLILLAWPRVAVAGDPPAVGHGVNATWLHDGWLKGAPPTDGDVDALVADLRDLDVSLVFPRVAFGVATPIPGADDQLGWVPDPVAGQRFIEDLRAGLPGVRVIPYYGWRECAWLADDSRRRSVVDAIVASADALHADGFQVDVECETIDSTHAEAFGAFLREVKQGLGEHRTLSIAIPLLCQVGTSLDQPPYAAAPWHDRLAAQPSPRRYCRSPLTWETAFSGADQVAVMIYDTWYQPGQVENLVELTAGQTWAGGWFAARHGTEFLPGMRFGTMEEGRRESVGWMHQHGVENPVHGWVGIRRVLDEEVADGQQVGAHVAGVSYFRLDLLYHPTWDPDPGQPYLEAIRSRGAPVAVP